MLARRDGDKSRKRFDEDFGATVECGKEQGWTLSYLYPPFVEQAKRVLKPRGLLLAKITDMVNCHRSKWPHCDFMRMAEETGFTVCDLIVKIRTGPMVSTKWKTAHHARKRALFLDCLPKRIELREIARASLQPA